MPILRNTPNHVLQAEMSANIYLFKVKNIINTRKSVK